ncbi:hypothetical protein [Geomicrobium sediminis]|uniref:Uncharacterized protein n=1 Tax=Geomicrobium sediminis TaxID=1347788 RepID=A0ABS2PFT9_9BACL|nr:hypothetical protein [Geomicrobium sediminis]MBM7634299.1 hypothetical protein [Geomicrobium sediminis]
MRKFIMSVTSAVALFGVMNFNGEEVEALEMVNDTARYNQTISDPFNVPWSHDIYYAAGQYYTNNSGGGITLETFFSDLGYDGPMTYASELLWSNVLTGGDQRARIQDRYGPVQGDWIGPSFEVMRAREATPSLTYNSSSVSSGLQVQHTHTLFGTEGWSDNVSEQSTFNY